MIRRGDTRSPYPITEATLLHGTPPADPEHKTLTGTVIHAGTQRHPFNLWMDHAYSEASETIKALIERRYSRGGKNYCYVTGKAFMYHKKHIPQILLESVEQIADVPVRDTAQLHHSGERYHLAAAAAAPKRMKDYIPAAA